MKREHPTIRCTAYLTNVFNRLDTVVKWAVSQLEPHKDEFDAIAFRGMSGAMVAPLVAIRLGKPFILVRKPDDSTHSSFRVEGAVCARYVIVDDLVSSGHTVQAIQKEITCAFACWGIKPVCVGIALWHAQDMFWRRAAELQGYCYYREYFVEQPFPEDAMRPSLCWALEKRTVGIDLASGPDTQVEELFRRYDLPPILFKRVQALTKALGGGYNPGEEANQ